MKQLLLMAVFFLVSSIAYSQTPLLNWEKIYQGNEYSVDSSSVMKMNEIDKSIYIGITTDAFGTANDLILIKRDFVTGDTLWTKRYDGPLNGDDQFVDLAIDQKTGAVFITGKSQGVGTGYDIVILKYSESGTKLWTKRWDNIKYHDDDFPSAIELDKTGNIYVSGSTYNGTTKQEDIILFKYNKNGDIINFITNYEAYELNCTYIKNIGQYYGDIRYYTNDKIQFMKINNNEDIIYAGETSAVGITYGFFDCIGPNPQISELYGSKLNTNYITQGNNGWDFNRIMIIGDKINSMKIDNSNNIYFVRTYTYISTNQKYLSVFKLDNTGETHYYLDIIIDDAGKNFEATNLNLDNNGNLYVIGFQINESNNQDWFIAKLDIEGKKKWIVNHNGDNNEDNKPMDVVFDNMQNPIIVGTMRNSSGKNEISILKLDKNTGSDIYMETYKKENCNTIPYNIVADNKNNIVINGIKKFDYKCNVLTLKYSDPIADAGDITGETNVCQGSQEVSYSVPVIESATSYSWALPEGANGNSLTNTIIISFEPDAVSGKISVKGINNFGEGKSSSLQISILPQPFIFAGSDTSVCEGTSITLEATGGSSYSWNNEVSQGVEFTPALTKEYIVIGSNQLCQNSDTIIIVVNPVPPPPSVYMEDYILYSTVKEGNQWYFNNGKIENANLDYHTPVNSGEYYAVVNNGTCESIPSNSINHFKTDIDNYNLLDNIKVYPNPSSEILTLEGLPNNKKTDIVLYDLNGKLIKEYTSYSSIMNMDVSNVVSGSYILIMNKQIEKTVKIIKE